MFFRPHREKEIELTSLTLPDKTLYFPVKKEDLDKSYLWDPELEDAKEKQALAQEIKDNPTIFNTLPCFNFSDRAEKKDWLNMIPVRQHAYAIQRFDDTEICLGTSNLRTCIGLIGINHSESLVGLAHLDGYTITPYLASLINMFAELRGKRHTIIDIYLIGGYRGESYGIPPFKSQSHLLVLSILKFIKQYNVCIKGVDLFRHDYTNSKSTNFILHISNSHFKISHLPGNCPLFFRKMENTQCQLYGLAIDKTGLICAAKARPYLLQKKQ